MKLRSWPWWKMWSRVKPLLNVANIEDELRVSILRFQNILIPRRASSHNFEFLIKSSLPFLRGYEKYYMSSKFDTRVLFNFNQIRRLSLIILLKVS